MSHSLKPPSADFAGAVAEGFHLAYESVQDAMLQSHYTALTLFLVITSAMGSTALAALDSSDPRGRDSILDWNAIALAAVATDYTGTYGPPDQKGPTRTSRALAIVHLAMFDAANIITPTAKPYLAAHGPTHLPVASTDAAVAQAAAMTLTALYPKQQNVFATALTQYLAPLANVTAKNNGIQIGRGVAQDILAIRSLDGANTVGVYTPSGHVGTHNVDPLNPGQGFLDPAWGHVVPFSPSSTFTYVPQPPPALRSQEYADAYNDVKTLGGDGIVTATVRTTEQTEIGVFWSYDGTPRLGTPPRLYNQIVRIIASQQKNTEIKNARLLALVNASMADAGILCWSTKYTDVFWRPILGIRKGDQDANPATDADHNWTPLGAQSSNTHNSNFTPNFPSYSSGHAAFGAATFRILQDFYGTDNIAFQFVSDELNGVTTDNHGRIRPLRPRQFLKLSDAANENARSRIYLGIHWQFDADEGLRSGAAVGDHVFQSILQLN